MIIMFNLLDSLTNNKTSSEVKKIQSNNDKYTDIEFKYKEPNTTTSTAAAKHRLLLDSYFNYNRNNDSNSKSNSNNLFNRNRYIYTFNTNNNNNNNEAIRCCAIMNNTTHVNTNRYVYGEIFLIAFILTLWIISVLLCMSKYSKLRSLQPLPASSGSGPMNIEEVQIIENEQDTVIYRKKRSRFDHASNATDSINLLNNPNIGYSPLKTLERAVTMGGTMKKRSSSEPLLNTKHESDAYSKISYLTSIDRSPYPILRKQQRNTIDHACRAYDSVEHTNETRKLAVSINDKRNLFANSRRRYYVMSEYRKLVDKKYKRNYSTSRQNSSRQDSLNTNATINSNNLLNPNWIPVEVRRNLLQLHSQSRKNLSKSDSNLKTNRQKKIFCSQRSNDNNHL